MTGSSDAERGGRATVHVRPVRPDDADALQRIRRLPSVVRFTMALASIRLADVRRRIENYGPDDHVMVAEVAGDVVGMAGLHVHGSKQRHVADLGIMVSDDHQGRGVGRALMTALLDLADSQLGLVRVELEVASENLAAIRLYESLGFEREGLKRHAFMVDGHLADLLIMGRLRR